MGHPLRRAHNLEESHVGRAKVFPRQVIDLVQEALQLRDAYRAGQRSREDLVAVYEDYVDRMHNLTARPRGNEVNNVFARHLYNYGHAWFAFLLQPDLPATNHEAEQALRTPIVNRKVFGGNRTDAGCEAQVITSSTIQTCKQQQRSAFSFLRDAVCGLVQSIFTTVTGASPSAATP